MKIFVVDKSNNMHGIANKSKIFANIIASVDLCKPDDIVHELKNCPESDCYIFLDGDGNTECTIDMYGDPIKETDLNTAISVLRKGIAATDGYSRYIIALNMLESFKIADMYKDNLAVLIYGH